MTDPIREELQADLHAATLGNGVACDYHQRPKTIAVEEPILFEAIKLVDHPQLQREEWPAGWVLDAARCADHSIEQLELPTRGFEEAVVEILLTESNDVMSVEMPESDDVRVIAYSPATDGLYPLVLDQQLLAASESGDVGLSRWMRVQGMVAADPPDDLREHVERLIEESPETPSSFE